MRQFLPFLISERTHLYVWQAIDKINGDGDTLWCWDKLFATSNFGVVVNTDSECFHLPIFQRESADTIVTSFESLNKMLWCNVDFLVVLLVIIKVAKVPKHGGVLIQRNICHLIMFGFGFNQTQTIISITCEVKSQCNSIKVHCHWCHHTFGSNHVFHGIKSEVGSSFLCFWFTINVSHRWCSHCALGSNGWSIMSVLMIKFTSCSGGTNHLHILPIFTCWHTTWVSSGRNCTIYQSLLGGGTNHRHILPILTCWHSGALFLVPLLLCIKHLLVIICLNNILSIRIIDTILKHEKGIGCDLAPVASNTSIRVRETIAKLYKVFEGQDAVVGIIWDWCQSSISFGVRSRLELCVRYREDAVDFLDVDAFEAFINVFFFGKNNVDDVSEILLLSGCSRHDRQLSFELFGSHNIRTLLIVGHRVRGSSKLQSRRRFRVGFHVLPVVWRAGVSEKFCSRHYCPPLGFFD